MSRVIFAVYDSTTARCLQPVARSLPGRVDVEYLLLDELLPRSAMGSSLSTEEFQPCRRASSYVNSELLQSLNEVENPHPVGTIVSQRLIEDNISPQITYDIDGYLADADPDVFVSGHDQLPFIKHIIERSHKQDFRAVVVQHGINRPDLENPSSLPGVPSLLSPDVNPRCQLLERLKRRIGFRYGAFLFCNPYIDELYTLGEYFTKLIKNLRGSYPCFGKTDVVTAGSTEYNPSGVTEYQSEVSSALFLSQWQYEHNIWTAQQQSLIVRQLERIESETDISITVRPHPKDSKSKIESFFSQFATSTDSDLESDIAAHDAVLTVDSTVLYAGAIQGKVCAVVQPPWDEVTFRPFTHEHIIEVTDSNIDISAAGAERSVETQRSYLTECCYVPAFDPSCSYSSPVEFVSARIEQMAQTAGK